MTSEKLNKEFIMIENDSSDGGSYLQDSNLLELFKNDEFRLVSEFDDVANIIIDKVPVRVYWVDIHLGVGRENEGMEMIKAIRENDMSSLIIVYSAYGYNRDECLKSGANFFFKKGSKYNDVMKEIYTICKRYLSDNGITSYFAKIIDIDEASGWLMLRCFFEGNLFDRPFKISRVTAAIGDQLGLGKIIQINISEIGAKTEIVVENSSKTSMGTMHEEDEYTRNPQNSFLNSNIFGKI